MFKQKHQWKVESITKLQFESTNRLEKSCGKRPLKKNLILTMFLIISSNKTMYVMRSCLDCWSSYKNLLKLGPRLLI
jgi:hypothetical protein